MKASPVNPYCIFWDSNSGQVGAWDISTGAPGCLSAFVSEASLANRGCSGLDRVLDRVSITMTNMTNGTTTDLKLTVLDGEGQPLAAWMDKPVVQGTPISLVGLTNTVTGPGTPTYLLTYSGVTGNPKMVFSFDYAGKGPEMCFSLIVDNSATADPFVEMPAQELDNGVPIYNDNTTLIVTPC